MEELSAVARAGDRDRRPHTCASSSVNIVRLLTGQGLLSIL